MQTLLVLLGYVVYFIFVFAYVSKTCDVNEYLTNADYRKTLYQQLDVPLLAGLACAVLLCLVLR